MKIILLIIASMVTASVLSYHRKNRNLTLHLRTRVKQSESNEQWHEQISAQKYDPSKIALLICDLWDTHWCRTLSERSSKIAEKAAPIV